jgi:hypothetical protein
MTEFCSDVEKSIKSIKPAPPAVKSLLETPLKSMLVLLNLKKVAATPTASYKLISD